MDNDRQSRLKRVPIGALPTFGILLLTMFLSYTVTKFINIGYGPFDLTTDFDRAVPFVPEFITIYVGSFVFWLIGFIVVAYAEREIFYNFACGVIITFAVSALFYVFLPTTIQWPDVSGDGFWLSCVRFIYSADSPQNLFPSMHCLLSWLYFISVRRSKRFPKGIKVLFCIISLAICASTQFVKQHYIADVLLALPLGEAGMYIVRNTNCGEWFGGKMSRLNAKLGLKNEPQ